MDGHFRLGMVGQHKDLLKPGDQCIGGGYYQFDWTSNRLVLDRASYDFGRPRWHLLEKAMANANRSMDEKLKDGRDYTYSELGRLIDKLTALSEKH